MERKIERPLTSAEYYETLPEGTRAELIDGEIYYMASPSWTHRRIQVNLCKKFDAYLAGKKCQANIDVDVKLTDERTLIPDLVVVCRPEIIIDGKVHGAPELVVEILSPSTGGYDKNAKLHLYQSAGVKECWIIDPILQTIEVFDLQTKRPNGIVRMSLTYTRYSTIRPSILDDCEIVIADIFPD